MKGNAVEMCLLFDFFGEMLTDKQKNIFDYYYNEDLSLAEISEITGITRQGVRDAIIRSEAVLRNMEEKTGLVKRFRDYSGLIEKVHNLINEFAITPDFRHLTNDNAGKIRQVWHLTNVVEDKE